LIQIADENEFHAIDVLADGIDLTPFYDLMANEKVLKVFHAAKQDIEIFVNQCGKVPVQMFDSQIAAMVCGYGDSIGYEKLVISITKNTLDKSTRFTDWSRRPLSQRQIDYALGDVTHLRDIYKSLRDQIQKAGRDEWLKEEMEALCDASGYTILPVNAYKRVKIRNSNPRFNAIVRKLAEWREGEAQSRNVPRNRIMRDEVMLEIAGGRPQHANALNGVRGLSPNFGSSKPGIKVIEIIKLAMSIPEGDLPKIKRHRPPQMNIDPIMELLKVLLKLKCQTENVAPKLIASMDDLEKLAQNDNADIPALKGWRFELFGEDALALKKGEMGFAMKDGEIITFNLNS
jgi:ribonuclease D